MEDEQQSYSLTYSEIGERLSDCVDFNIITMEQAQEIGNRLFPITEEHTT